MADRTESTIIINASVAAITEVIADLEAYPQWSEGITSVEVLKSQENRPVAARFILDVGIIKDTYELAYTWKPELVEWHLVDATVLSLMDGSYQLRDLGDGSTEVAYALTVDIKIPMLGMLKRKAEKTIIDTALKGLKARVEQA
ncbi:MAG: SRPBCC family protein [Candidatus Nanopelagicales bacterium]|nr:SRPBCC family protein [Candidatus Nanopelagicales bacterium]